MIKHIKHWNEWRKHNINSWWYKLLVLFKMVESPTWNAVNLEAATYYFSD